jgi:hypothetical protein
MHNDGCIPAEPDVVLCLSYADGERQWIAIEAKRVGGTKSSVPDNEVAYPTDQLAREWDNLLCLASKNSPQPVLIYLTEDFYPPWEEIQESREEFARKRPLLYSSAGFRVAWLSWRHMAAAFDRSSSPIIQDLARFARKSGLLFFDGVSPIRPCGYEWYFSQPISATSIAPTRFVWKFSVE